MNEAEIRIRQATGKDAAAISRLIVPVAQAQITHEFTQEGRDTMLGRLDAGTIRWRIRSGYRYDLAFDADRLLGVIGMRGYSHLYHLFVAHEAQGRGIGRLLWEKAAAASLREVSLTEFTVFSSRYAEGFYRRLGFQRTGEEKIKSGVVAIPMRLTLENRSNRGSSKVDANRHKEK